MADEEQAVRNLLEYPITNVEKLDALREAIEAWTAKQPTEPGQMIIGAVTLTALHELERELAARLEPREQTEADFARMRLRRE